jgi:Amt family ammonium transporter
MLSLRPIGCGGLIGSFSNRTVWLCLERRGNIIEVMSNLTQKKLKGRNKRLYPRWGAATNLAFRTVKRLKIAIGRLSPSWQACVPLATLILLAWGCAAIAQMESAPAPLPAPIPEAVSAPAAVPTVAELKVALDTLWVTIAAFLVFFMNAGFCMLETGLCRQKNAVNVLSKNLIVFALATVAFWAIGFGLMFGDGNDFIGLNGFFLTGTDNSPAKGAAYEGVFDALNWTGVPLSAKFLFELVFAGTAATIVSGAVAERIKFVDFLIFSLLLAGISYPITGHWIWGGGWLHKAGFYDFAGSTAVHSVGGWAALMGAAFLGPRLGKYEEGQSFAMPGHNMSIATLGCLILWLGWFGFNPGSVMAANPGAISHIAVTTNMSGAVGGIAATIASWLYLGKPDLSMIINGILAGLVSVTGSCAYIKIGSAFAIGLIAGILVVFAVTFFERLKIDDPVGATSVHLVCGIWGTLAVGLFSVGPGGFPWMFDLEGKPIGPHGLFMGGGLETLGAQIVGIVSVGGMTVLLSTLFWRGLKATLGIRVSPQEEFAGLDIGEHGMEAYSGFVKEAGAGGFIPERPSGIGGSSGGMAKRS